MVSKTTIKKKTVCVVGLGYVGMPLVEAFSKKIPVIGFDINKTKVKKLKKEFPKIDLTVNPVTRGNPARDGPA